MHANQPALLLLRRADEMARGVQFAAAMKVYGFAVIGALVACGAPAGTVVVDASAQGADARPVEVDAVSATTSVQGTLAGEGFIALDAISHTANAFALDFDASSTDITLSPLANQCELEHNPDASIVQRALILELATTNAAGHSSTITNPGTYGVFSGSPPPSSNLVQAVYAVDGCFETASAGVVTVTMATSPLIGTFDLTFPDGHITGSFRAPDCDALDPNSSLSGFCE